MKRLLSFFQRYVFQYGWWFVAGTVFLFLTNWLSVQIPLQLAKAVDALRAGGPDARSILWSAVLTIAAMGVAVILVRTLSRVLFFTPGRLVEFQVKNELFARLLALQPSFYATEAKTGDIISRASSDLTFLRVMVGFGTLQVVNITAALLFTGTQMLRLSWTLTLWMLLPILLAMVLVQFGIRRMFTLMMRSQRELSDLSDHILSSLQGVQTIQGFNAEDAFTKRFTDRNEAYMKTNLGLVGVRAIVLPLLALAGAVSVWLLLAVGGPMTQTGQLTVGGLVAFSTYIAYLLMPLRSLGWVLSVYQRGMASLERIDELLLAEPERPELPEPVALSAEGGLHFALKDLSFAYPDEPERPVLQGINIELPVGSTVGIFGRTGSGKTTLLRLLTRVYNPPTGSLFVNGVDITQIDLDTWRRQMAVVPQVPFLFSDSIADNITMGKRDDARLAQVIESAALTQDIAMLPDGLDTLVGERGIMLSGGQRQRVSLARALYRDFKLLVLDDVLSAVDHKTEHQLIKSLEKTMSAEQHDGGRPTSILVSHRLSALTHADIILVLDEGRLIDQGTHEALSQRPGLYRDAWLHQSENEEEPMLAEPHIDTRGDDTNATTTASTLSTGGSHDKA